jgi:hypothetical protein
MIKKLQTCHKLLLDNPNFETDEQLKWQEALIANRIEHLEQVNSHNNRTRLKAKIVHHREILGGVWSDLNKVKKPRDTLLHLAELNVLHPQFITRSDKMANITREYHNTLQEKDLPHHNKNPCTGARSNIRQNQRSHECVPRLLEIQPHILPRVTQSDDPRICSTSPEVSKNQLGHWPGWMPVQTLEDAQQDVCGCPES